MYVLCSTTSSSSSWYLHGIGMLRMANCIPRRSRKDDHVARCSTLEHGTSSLSESIKTWLWGHVEWQCRLSILLTPFHFGSHFDLPTSIGLYPSTRRPRQQIENRDVGRSQGPSGVDPTYSGPEDNIPLQPYFGRFAMHRAGSISAVPVSLLLFITKPKVHRPNEPRRLSTRRNHSKARCLHRSQRHCHPNGRVSKGYDGCLPPRTETPSGFRACSHPMAPPQRSASRRRQHTVPA